ncbi:glycosyltransferase family 4 protein [Ferrimonas lipolytica]|uniref:Glycosyltransferase family 4 protein n=1 Tax=Ferrimonas lipolytica TaxID=2724191 RepID=A0A6H1UJ68_9GAMM|nr:glycosyltransferase family 4 protein [Ferrimonas lipolytica]QIZ78353.1 glycosyltransferase family 4 protein [Ferrimonas lipolytica]
MKIAISHIRHADTGGTEQFLNQIAHQLAVEGHHVSILCRTHANASHPNIKFVAFNNWALGRGHRLWRFAKDVERHIGQHSYDVVLGLGRTWSQDIIRVGGGLYREQIGQGQGKSRWWPKDIIARLIEKRSFTPSNYQLVLANSEQTRHSLANEYQIPTDKMVTIHNAVDISRFSDSIRSDAGLALRQQCGFSESNNVFLFLGSGYQRKGLDRLLPAFAEIAKTDSNARLIVVGFESSQASYQRLAETLNIDQQVTFLGGRKDVEVCYNAADCYVMPTRFDAFGYSAIEALACGLPVIITDSAGAAEVMPKALTTIVSNNEDTIQAELVTAMQQHSGKAKQVQFRQQAIAAAANNSIHVVMQKNIDQLLRIAAAKKQKAAQ